MDLAPSQYRQFNSFFTSGQADSLISWPQLKDVSTSSAHHAFRFLYFLNCGFFAYLKFSEIDAHARFIREWPSSTTARWIAPLFPKTAARLQKYWMRAAERRAQYEFLRSFANSRSTLGSTWWSFLTATFTHVTWDHLSGNVLAAIPASDIVAKLPGMNALHVLGIAVGCSIATTTTTLYRIRGTWYFMADHGFGFSGVVCALNAIAVLGSPRASVPVLSKFGFPKLALPFRYLVALQLVSDVVRTIRHIAGRPTAQDLRIGTLQHFAGYAFGALYYMLFLWRRRPRTFATSAGQRLGLKRRASI